jgi:hypothetical protein
MIILLNLISLKTYLAKKYIAIQFKNIFKTNATINKYTPFLDISQCLPFDVYMVDTITTTIHANTSSKPVIEVIKVDAKE